MPDISKIQLPGSGGIYNIKDAVAREMISGGVSFIVAWDGTSAPDIFSIPAGVIVKYNGTNYTGLLSAEDATAGAFYLVKSGTTTSGAPSDVYDEYVPVGAVGERSWEKIGDTQVDLNNVVTNVILSKQTDVALGENTTFTNSDSQVNFSNGTNATVLGANTIFTGNQSNVTLNNITNDNVLGEDTTFNTSVIPETTYLGLATTNNDFVTSVTTVADKKLDVTTITGVNGTESVSAVSKSTSKLETTTIPDITSATDVTIRNIATNQTVTANKSTWTFMMGTGEASETLIIGGGNGNDVTATNTELDSTNIVASKITLGANNKTVATGSISSNGTGDDVLSGLTIIDKTVAKAADSATTVATGTTSTTGSGDAIVTGVAVGSPSPALTSINLTTSDSSASGRVQVATGIDSSTTEAVKAGTGSDVVTVVTSVGGGVAAGQTITVGTNDRQTVVKTIGDAIAEAQTITVGDNDEITVLTDSTSLNVVKGQ